jgi:hypothetical protein
MGQGDGFLRRQTAAFRNALERAVVAKAGSVTVAQASRIHTAAVALRRHLQVERRLAKDGAAMSVADWTSLADRSVKFKETVDRCLVSLGLEALAKEPDPWQQMMRQPVALPPAPTSPSEPSQPTAHPGPDDLVAGLPRGPEAMPGDEQPDAAQVEHAADRPQPEGDDQ